MTKEQEVFILADEALNNVVRKIKDEQWHMAMPESFVMADGRKLDLCGVINYHAYDDAWVPDMMAGKTMDEAGKDKFDGDLLGDAPKENFAAIVQKATDAVRNLDDPERTIHFTYGDFSARDALTHITFFRGFRVHDISTVIGIDTDMPPELVQGLWDQIAPNIDWWRSIGVFPAPVDVPADAPLQSRLLGLAGRQP
jgi:hypothetical protein